MDGDEYWGKLECGGGGVADEWGGTAIYAAEPWPPSLFVKAEDWTGVDSDGDGIPDWWIWQYFGNLAESATNLDAGATRRFTTTQTALIRIHRIHGVGGQPVLEFQSRAGATERLGWCPSTMAVLVTRQTYGSRLD